MSSSHNDTFPSHVDLTNCDKEPIHLLGNIQPFGCFIALRSDWLVAYCSNNVELYLGVSANDLIGEPLKNWLDRDTLHHIRSALQSSMITEKNERLFNQSIDATQLNVDVSVHYNGNYIIVEFEVVDEQHQNDEPFVRSLLAQFYRAADSNELIDMVTQQLQLITGFDRVMLYRFLPDGAGEVAAEARAPSLESFLGLRYPASDIPKQARELYKKNLLRVIGDVNAEPIPILPRQKTMDKQIDLSFSTLRAVSPIHIEYLKNMGVDASLSVSLIINGKLWGLFACHHYAPKVPSYFQRTELELFAEVFALELGSRLASEKGVEKDRIRDIHNRLMANMASDSSLVNNIAQQFSVLQKLINCDGMIVVVDGQTKREGDTLPEVPLKKLTRYLNSQAPSEIHYLDSLEDMLDDYSTADYKVAGCLAIPISRSPRDYLLFLRNAQTQTISWAGNPQKSVSYGPNGSRLMPRASFALWQETHNDRCNEWTEQELLDAESLRVSLLEVMIRYIQERDDILLQASRKHEVLISELNHRVRNILNLVNAIVMQTEQSGRSLQEFIEVLTGRLLSLASAHDQLTAAQWSNISFRKVLDTEIQAYLNLVTNIELDGEDIDIVPEATTPIVLIMHEMFTNAAKYGALSGSSRLGTVTITWHKDGNGDLKILWRERGGPPVQPPSRESFGLTMIRSVIPHELGGHVDLEFPPHGVTASITVPKRYVLTKKSEVTSTEKSVGESVGLNEQAMPDVALVVEDSLVIALDMQKKLKRMGIGNVSVAGNITTAKNIIDRCKPGLVVFDVHLGRETTLGLVQNMLEQGIPSIIVSGYGEELAIPSDLKEVPVLSKPVAENRLIQAVSQLLSTGVSYESEND